MKILQSCINQSNHVGKVNYSIAALHLSNLLYKVLAEQSIAYNDYKYYDTPMQLFICFYTFY